MSTEIQEKVDADLKKANSSQVTSEMVTAQSTTIKSKTVTETVKGKSKINLIK